MTYTITRDGTTQTFDNRDEWEDVQSLLDENGVDYEATADGGQPETPNEDESAQNGSQDVTSEREYLTEQMGVPELFVVGLKGGYHVTKEGYYHLADQQDITFGVEPLNPTYDGDSDTSVWLGRATDANGREYTNVGTAHLSGENMGGAEYNLDELAATRAACRVLSMATGIGATSKEEMQ